MVSDEFKRNVESGNVVTVRSALVDYLIIDTSFRRFDDALDYAQNHINVVVPDDEEQSYDFKEENWDEEYLNKQKVALMINFSMKRINHIKQVIRKVLTNNASSVSSVKIIEKKSEVKTQDGKTGRKFISEERVSNPKTEKKINQGSRSADAKSPVDIATWMIGGGIAVAASGGITAGIGAISSQSAVLYTGLAVAGLGGVIAVTGGVIKAVRK